MIFCFVFLGFCFDRWGFAAGGLVSGLGWSWDGLVLDGLVLDGLVLDGLVLDGLVLDGLVLGRIAPGMGFWAFVRDILRVWSEVFAPSRPGLGVFGSGFAIRVG